MERIHIRAVECAERLVTGELVGEKENSKCVAFSCGGRFNERGHKR